MRTKKLKHVVVNDETPASVEKREEAFAELVQLLDDRSLQLIIRDANDDGRKAMEILRHHYAGRGKQRIISLYTPLTRMQKEPNEDLTGYIIRAETAANALKRAGSIVCDELLIAMVLNGLPPSYKPFAVIVNQSDKVMTFSEFKQCIRNFEENEKASNDLSNKLSSVMNIQHYPTDRRDDRRDDGRRNYNQNNNRQHNKPGILKQNGQGNGGGSRLICFSCDQPGHKWEDCTFTCIYF